MADPKIRLKRSSVEGKIPTPDQVPLGEIALNTYDGYLYASKNVGIGTTVIAINPFRVGTGTNTYNAYFTAGNVGIGSEIPTTKLDVDGTVTATSFVKSGGTASQYLMADGSVSTGGGGDSSSLGGISSTGYLRSDVADTKSSGNLTFSDNVSIILGDSSDTSINHDGTDTTIVHRTGDFKIQTVAGDFTGDDIILNAADDVDIQVGGGTTAIYATGGGSVKLNHNGSTKLETTSSGATVTGTVSATDVSVASGHIILNNSGASVTGVTTSTSFVKSSNSGGFLKADGTEDTNTYLTDISQDTTPQLGGNLDVNTKNINFGDSGSASDDRLTFGAGTDLSIYHNSNDSYIDNNTRHLYIRTNVASDTAGNIYLKPHDNENGIIVTHDGEVQLYYDNVEKLNTSSTGITVTGTGLATDEWKVNDGDYFTAGTGNDFRIYHTGSNTILDNNTGSIYIRSNVDGDDGGNIYLQAKSGENGIIINDDGEVQLYYDNAEKLNTSSSGITVTGTGLATNAWKVNDDDFLIAGTGDDLKIWHSGSASLIDNNTGNLYIRTNVDGDDGGNIYLRPHDNEEGIIINDDGEVQLFYDNVEKLNTSADGITVTGTGLATVEWKVNDDDYFTAGTGNDFRIFHTGTNTYLDNSTGHLYIRNNASTDVGGNIYLRPRNAEEGIIINDDGEVQLYYDNAEKLNTSSSGITVAGSIGVNVDSPEYDLDFGETSASTIRIVSENTGTAIRIGAGGNGNSDVTLLRVDGDSSQHNGESDNSNYGFSTKYMGTRTGNNNSLSIFSDNQTGTAVEAITINQDGSIGINSTSPTTRLDVDGNANINGSVTATSIVKSGGTSSQFLKADGSVDSSTYLTSYTETDPVVAAINGIVKSDGTTISAATAGTDYLTDISQDTTPQLGGNLDLNSNDITGTGNLNITGIATFSGNVTIGGTLTYEDVTNIDSVGLVTARSGINVSAGGINVTGVSTFQDHVHLGNDDVLRLGDNQDLRIFYNSNNGNSVIAEHGSGNLHINADDLQIKSTGSTEVKAKFITNGAVELYHDNSKKLETTGTGVSFTDNIENYNTLVGSASTTMVDFTVTVAAKSDHRYSGGSSNAYYLNGIESPFLTLTPGRTYNFKQDDNSNSSHPFRFYLEADKTTQYTEGVTSLGSPGSTGGMTSIEVTDETPVVLHYQCSSHDYMGNAVQVNSNKVDTPYQIDGLKGANITGVVTATSFVKSSNSGGFLKADGTEDTNTYLTSLGTAIVDGDFTSNGFMKRTGAGTYAVDSNTYLTSYTETDPVVGAINGIVKANGSGTISAATAGTDYLTPSGDGSSLTGLTGASAATYGSAGATPVIVVDSDGRITGISTVATSGGGGGGSVSEAFKTIAVSGQSDVVADGATDTLTLVAGSNMTITTNASGDSITFASSGSGGGSSSTRTVNRYVATQSQTLFPASGTISYSVGYLDVYLNGSRLDTTEFTATNGTTVTLATGASANDIVELVAFTNLSLTDVTVANDSTPQLGGNLDLNGNNITGTGNINITGTATVSGSQVATQNDAIAFAIALG